MFKKDAKALIEKTLSWECLPQGTVQVQSVSQEGAEIYITATVKVSKAGWSAWRSGYEYDVEINYRAKSSSYSYTHGTCMLKSKKYPDEFALLEIALVRHGNFDLLLTKLESQENVRGFLERTIQKYA